jgi:chemotaxis signal transduction protein
VTTLLRVAAGGHELLLPGASVRRVAEGADAARDLPVLDLAQILGGTPGTIVIHYGEDESGETLLVVDEVKGMVNVADQMLARLPPLSSQFAQLFDSITLEAIDGRHPLCLRARLRPRTATPEAA